MTVTTDRPPIDVQKPRGLGGPRTFKLEAAALRRTSCSGPGLLFKLHLRGTARRRVSCSVTVHRRRAELLSEEDLHRPRPTVPLRVRFL